MLRKPSRTQCVLLIDVKRAHFVSPAGRRIAAELLQELLNYDVHEVGLLKVGDVWRKRRRRVPRCVNRKSVGGIDGTRAWPRVAVQLSQH